MLKEKPQFFTIDCPHCGEKMNAAHVAQMLPPEVFAVELASRNGKRQTRHAGPGRPSVVRCPGCDIKMPTAELREHRLPCLRDRLNTLQFRHVRLYPKDPDPYPDFFLQRVSEDKADFEKLSSSQYLSIELQKISEISINAREQRTYIRVLGRVSWDGTRKQWNFLPRLASHKVIP